MSGKKFVQLPMHNCSVPKHIDQVPSCFDDIIATICSYYKLNYIPMFAQSYSFEYSDDYEIYYKSIYTTNIESELLYNCSGVSYKFFRFENTSALLDIIYDELINNRPVAIHFDAYYCHWDQFYGVLHNNHMVMVTGFDMDNEKIFVCDSWFDTQAWIDFNVLNTVCKYYVLFAFDKPRNHIFDDYYMIENLQKSICRNIQSVFENIRRFGYDFLIKFNADDLDCDNYFFSEFHTLLQGVIYSRCKYLTFLQYMSEKSKIITQQKCIEFKRFVLAWRSVQWMIGKAYVQKATASDQLIHRISKKIILLANEEEFFVTNLLSSSDNSNKCVSNSINIHSSDCAKNINLSSFLNNKAFDYMSGIYRADFGGINEFFALDNVDTIREFSHDNINLHLFDNVHNEYDNVICLGQEITVSVRSMTRLLICGCCEYGSYADYWQAVDSQGNINYFEVSISDYPAPPRAGETVVYTNDVYCAQNGKIELCHPNCHIFAEDIRFDKPIEIQKFILPYCPCMHIFSIIIL